MLSGSKTFGIFIDFPSKIRWDIGYTTANKTVITIDGTDFDIYYIDGTKPLEIVKEFRKSIGTSYVPPFWAFGYQQSRWSYHNAEAVDAVVDGYNKAGIPLDCVYLDIDYMERYKDFTVDDEKFPNFKDYVQRKGKKESTSFRLLTQALKRRTATISMKRAERTDTSAKTRMARILRVVYGPVSLAFPIFSDRM